tara:strand:- start:3696 stop:4028 length:333 start_codon:yes stop_codon:yes gene_type:complete
MHSTVFQIYVAIIMVAVFAGLFVWFRRSEAAGSAKRLTGMMSRFGLDPRIATQGDSITKTIMNAARWRCRKCPTEGHCERWLCGKVEGGNTFCPNAQTFSFLSAAGKKTG